MNWLCHNLPLGVESFIERLPSPPTPREGKKRDFYIKLIKNIQIEIKKKSGFGGVLGQFWVWIRILREKCYIELGSDRFFIDF